jgi:hypothetical protein
MFTLGKKEKGAKQLRQREKVQLRKALVAGGSMEK